MTPSFIPTPLAQFVLWFDQFSIKFPGYAVLFGFTPAEAAAVRADFLWMQFATLQAEIFKGESTQRISYRDELRDGPLGLPASSFPSLDTIVFPPGSPVAPGIEPRLRALIQRVKNHPSFTDPIGQDLGIIPPAVVPPLVVKPTGTANPLPNFQVQVTYFKDNHTGVTVECQRGSETEWTSLGLKVRASFIDARPPLVPGQPEVHRYRLRYQDGDNAVGEYSDIICATATP